MMVDTGFKDVSVMGEKINRKMVDTFHDVPDPDKYCKFAVDEMLPPPVDLVEFCDGCIHISPTEEEQDNPEHKLFGTTHRCKVLDIRLMHQGQHPRIPRPEFCYLYKEKESGKS